MTKYNSHFELNVEDVDLIETALRRSEAKRPELREAVEDLLGRLHDQKMFYRPKGAYVSG